MLLVILKAKKFLERFTKKKVQKINKEVVRVKKVIKMNYMLHGKATTIFLTVGLIKKT